MRILFVSHDHPFTGHTGVSVYCRDLFPALMDRGVDIGAICVQHRDWRFRPYVRATQEHGITLFSLANSPLHPEISLRRPAQDHRQPAVERLMQSCLRQFRPDVLHVQTFHGYPAAILALAKEFGIPSVVTFHDFWVICPRVLLVRVQGEPCEGPNAGESCARYCAAPLPWQQRMYQSGTRLPEGRVRTAFFWARSTYRRVRRRQASAWTPRPAGPARIDRDLVSQYAQRNDELRHLVHQADQLIAVSEFTKSVLVRHGFDGVRIRTLPPALASSEQIVWKPRRVTTPPVRFGFLGRLVFLKGAHVFAQAVRGIPAGRARFLMFGPAAPETERYLQELAGDGVLEFRGPYARRDLPAVLDQIDVVVVPSVAQETVGLVVQEAQAGGLPIIGARTGAIPEQVRDGESGWLFRAGDADDLREKMMRVVEHPELVAMMSAQTRPPLSMREHADALLDIYREVTQKGRRVPWIEESAASSPRVDGAAG